MKSGEEYQVAGAKRGNKNCLIFMDIQLTAWIFVRGIPLRINPFSPLLRPSSSLFDNSPKIISSGTSVPWFTASAIYYRRKNERNQVRMAQ